MAKSTIEAVAETVVLKHRLQSRLERLVAADRHGVRPNVLLTGGAGSGKSSAGKLLATQLGLPFYFIEQITMGHQLVGSRDPHTGEWRHTPFTKAALEGGVCMWEEYDAWMPNATLAGNVPLANRYLSNPVTGEVIDLHPDCIIIACANTWGQGATMEYVGRNKMDGAALDRFDVRLHWDYDEQLEKKMCHDPDVAEFVQMCRYNAEKAKLRVLITPRATKAIDALVHKGFSVLEAADMHFLAGLSKADRAVVLDGTEMYHGDGNTGELPFKHVMPPKRRRVSGL